MIRRNLFLASVLTLLALPPEGVFAAKVDEQPWDGLIQVDSPRMDAVYLMPGADFRAYDKVMLDVPEVAFRKDWMRNMNNNMGSRLTAADAEKILATVQSNTTDIFAEAFTKAGHAVVTERGTDVLRVSSAVINLYVNAPDTRTSGFSRTYTANAGEATLVLELRDSLTNALLARVLDRRETQGMPGPSSSASNLSEYRQLAARWAKTSVKGLDTLKAISPVPDSLTPGQKLN